MGGAPIREYLKLQNAGQHLLLHFIADAVCGTRDRLIEQLSKASSDVADPHGLNYLALGSTSVGA